MNKQLLSQRIETGLLFLWGFTLLVFPLLYTTYTTSAFLFPKIAFVSAVVLISLLAWGVQILLTGQVRIKRTPLDIPVILFTVAVLLSAIFSANRADSLVGAIMIVFAALTYFVLVNVFRFRKVALFLLSSLLAGGVLSVVVTVLAYVHLYVLPFASAKSPTFTPLGTYTEFFLVVAMLLPLCVAFLMPVVKKQFTARVGVFALAGLVLAGGLVLAVVSLLTVQKPILLPFDFGFQTAFAAISQDTGRVLQTFFFGEGYATFADVFSRFHSANFNANQQLWYLSFPNSSSYLLELLATTGLVGLLSYLFMAFRALTPVKEKRKNPFFLSVVVALVLSAVLPFSAVEVFLVFFLMAGLTLAQREMMPQDYFDIELRFVALKKGVVSFTTLDITQQGRSDRHPTPFVALVVLLALAIGLGYYATIYTVSDVLFQQSLVAANANNGTAVYGLQAQAITVYPFRSDYYRIFSQTNIALANSLLSLNSGKSSPSAQTQQTAFALIQQGIATARTATNYAPDSAVGWQNLSSVYRSLIGVGQNADTFAVQSAQQAIALNPANPQEYINLGGIYYQIGQYDNAVRAFQQAIALKNDYANAYYNLGHTYEQQGNLQLALAQYQVVKSLVANSPQSVKQIDQEIAALQAKVGSAGSAQTGGTTPTTQQQPLQLPQTNQLPAQKQEVPLASPTPAQ